MEKKNVRRAFSGGKEAKNICMYIVSIQSQFWLTCKRAEIEVIKIKTKP